MVTTGQMIVIQVDGTQVVTELDRSATLKEVQTAVGGWVELLTQYLDWPDGPAQMYCNEHGKIEGLPLNIVATALLIRTVQRFPDVLVGPVVVLVGAARWLPNPEDDL